MASEQELRDLRLRRERVLKRDNPRVRPLEEKDAWVMWAAYDLGSFPSLPKDLTREQFFALVAQWAQSHSSLLVVEANHRYFKSGRGPVALVTVDNFGGWQLEVLFDFFFWATKRQRLAAAVAFFHMVRWSRKIGVCVVRVTDKDVDFCEHLYKYDLLRPCGKLPNACPEGTQHIYYVKGRKEQEQELRKAA